MGSQNAWCWWWNSQDFYLNAATKFSLILRKCKCSHRHQLKSSVEFSQTSTILIWISNTLHSRAAEIPTEPGPKRESGFPGPIAPISSRFLFHWGPSYHLNNPHLPPPRKCPKTQNSPGLGNVSTCWGGGWHGVTGGWSLDQTSRNSQWKGPKGPCFQFFCSLSHLSQRKLSTVPSR